MDGRTTHALNEVLQYQESAARILKPRTRRIHNAHWLVPMSLVAVQQLLNRRKCLVCRNAIDIMHVQRLVRHQVRHRDLICPFWMRGVKRPDSKLRTRLCQQHVHTGGNRNARLAELLHHKARTDALTE